MSQRKFKRAHSTADTSKKAKETSSQPVHQATPEPAGDPAHQPMIQAMVWYKEEDWDTLMTLFTDREMLPKSYADWLKRAEAMKKEIQDQGDVVIKVFIDPQTFPEWCARKGVPMNSEARSDLAIEVAQAQGFSL